MGKNSLKKDGKDKEFAEFGEYETVETKQKANAEAEPEVIEKKIYYDKRQYSCKLPPEMMETIGYKEGDKLKFILMKNPVKGKAELRVEYARK